ncbi:unnamed protein product [Victoria cruziana]
MDILARHWVRFGTFLLIDDAKVWWKSLLNIRFGGQHPTWEEFSVQFRETYVPQVTRERRVREFLELAQSGRSVAEYAVKFRHLQRYSPQLFGSEKERANKFVWGLDEGLRPRVMSNNPPTLLQAVKMAIRMEEDYCRSQTLMRKQKGLAPVAQQFKKASGASKAFRPPLARPTIFVKPSASGFRVLSTYFHCNKIGYIWRDCPMRRDRDSSVTTSSPVTQQRAVSGATQPRAAPTPAETRPEPMPVVSAPTPVPAPHRDRPAGRIYTTSIQDLQSQDLIQGTLLLNEFFVRVLFDIGASHSFVARELARQLGSEVIVALFALKISSPLGGRQIDLEYILVEGLYIEDRAFPAQLILLDMTEFDVISGMDWLT